VPERGVRRGRPGHLRSAAAPDPARIGARFRSGRRSSASQSASPPQASGSSRVPRRWSSSPAYALPFVEPFVGVLPASRPADLGAGGTRLRPDGVVPDRPGPGVGTRAQPRLRLLRSPDARPSGLWTIVRDLALGPPDVVMAHVPRWRSLDRRLLGRQDRFWREPKRSPSQPCARATVSAGIHVSSRLRGPRSSG
jgi:hypothetical protein